MLEPLKIFVDLIQTESFSRAATRNFLTQSAVSQRIRQLERDLGQQLVIRGRGRMRPTEAGKILFEASQEILERFARARDDLNRIRDVVSGTLCVATVPSIGLHHLPAGRTARTKPAYRERAIPNGFSPTVISV